MDRDFQRFPGGPNEAASKRLHATITPERLIRINRNIHELLGKPDAVRLYYSEKRDSIGVEASNSRLNDAFPVKPSGKTFRINAAPFMRHFNIHVDSTLKFVAPEIVGRELFLKLGETISVSRPKAQRRRK